MIRRKAYDNGGWQPAAIEGHVKRSAGQRYRERRSFHRKLDASERHLDCGGVPGNAGSAICSAMRKPVHGTRFGHPKPEESVPTAILNGDTRTRGNDAQPR